MTLAEWYDALYAAGGNDQHTAVGFRWYSEQPNR